MRFGALHEEHARTALDTPGASTPATLCACILEYYRIPLQALDFGPEGGYILIQRHLMQLEACGPSCASGLGWQAVSPGWQTLLPGWGGQPATGPGAELAAALQDAPPHSTLTEQGQQR